MVVPPVLPFMLQTMVPVQVEAPHVVAFEQEPDWNVVPIGQTALQVPGVGGGGVTQPHVLALHTWPPVQTIPPLQQVGGGGVTQPHVPGLHT